MNIHTQLIRFHLVEIIKFKVIYTNFLQFNELGGKVHSIEVTKEEIELAERILKVALKSIFKNPTELSALLFARFLDIK